MCIIIHMRCGFCISIYVNNFHYFEVRDIKMVKHALRGLQGEYQGGGWGCRAGGGHLPGGWCRPSLTLPSASPSLLLSPSFSNLQSFALMWAGLTLVSHGSTVVGGSGLTLGCAYLPHSPSPPSPSSPSAPLFTLLSTLLCSSLIPPLLPSRSVLRTDHLISDVVA